MSFSDQSNNFPAIRMLFVADFSNLGAFYRASKPVWASFRFSDFLMGQKHQIFVRNPVILIKH